MSSTPTTGFGLEAYVSEICRLMDRDLPIPETVEQVAELNHRLIAADFRLPDELRVLDPDAAYTRNLVYQDPQNRFSIIAILWGSFQETRVHDHLNWCVVGALEGSCLSVDYDRLDDESDPAFAELRVREATLLKEGGVCALLPPPRSNIHKLSNAGHKVAITLHTYGDPGAKARVFEPSTGAVEVVDLKFHNQQP